MYLMILVFLCSITKEDELNDKVVTSEQSNNVLNLGLNVMIRSDEKRMQYWKNYGNNKLDGSVEDLINYAGQVTRFQSLFMDFVQSITTEINEKELSPDIINNINKLMPEADVNIVFDFAKVIRRSVQEYSMVVLQSMSKLKHLPTKVKRLAKVAKTYEKMGKEVIPVPKLERLFNIKELKHNFRSLQHLSNEGLGLANYFFDVYQSIAPISKDLKDYIQQKKRLSIELESEMKHREEILREKIIEERNLKLQEEYKIMYEGYIKDLSSSSTNKEGIWATIVDTDIKKAKTEKENAEKRLRDYTYRMWGVYVVAWQNDVAQAKIDVDKWTKVLNRLTDEKKKGFQNDVMEKKKEHYTNLMIKTVTEVQQHEENLKKVINPKLEKIENNIERIKLEIEVQKERKKDLFEGNADIRASAERLIDAIDATQSFAAASVEQAVAQNTFTVGHKDDYQALFFTMEDLFDEGSSLQDQKEYIQLIEDVIAETSLLSFLGDSNSLLTYPVLEKAEIQIMYRQINQNHHLLPKLEL